MPIQTITTPSDTYTVELPQGWTRARALKAGEALRAGVFVLPVTSGKFEALRASCFGATVQAGRVAYAEGYYFVDDPTPEATPAPVANDSIPASVPEEQIQHIKDLTHGAVFHLSNGAELSIARGDKGWLLAGEWNGFRKHIAFSDEAMEVIAETFLDNGFHLLPIKHDSQP